MEKSKIRFELEKVYNNCNDLNWCGHTAIPIQKNIIDNVAIMFENCNDCNLPDNFGAESDGSLTIEWYKNKYNIFTISVDNILNFYYSYLKENFMKTGKIFNENLNVTMNEIQILIEDWKVEFYECTL